MPGEKMNPVTFIKLSLNQRQYTGVKLAGKKYGEIVW